jgi:hypothetical protein
MEKKIINEKSLSNSEKKNKNILVKNSFEKKEILYNIEENTICMSSLFAPLYEKDCRAPIVKFFSYFKI